MLLANKFREVTSKALLECASKKIVLSGPSGFLGGRMLDSILDVYVVGKSNGEDPGEVILMSANPVNLMTRLTKKYGLVKMKTIRASCVDYYTQHDVNTQAQV